MITLFSPIVCWLTWLTIKSFSNEKLIAVNTTNDVMVKTQISEMKSDFNGRIDRLENHVDTKFDQVSAKFEKVFEKIDQISR